MRECVEPERVEDLVGEHQVRQLGVCTDVVDLAGRALINEEMNGRTVVLNVEPVTFVPPVSVERHVLALEQVRHEQRDDLLRELVRTIVVGAPRHDDVVAVGGSVGQGEEVGSCLRRRVRRRRVEWCGLRSEAVFDRSVHLIGRHMQESVDAMPVRRINHDPGPDHVGLEEHRRPGDRPIDVALCSEVHDNVVTRHDLVDQCGVANVAFDESMAGEIVQLGNGCRHSGIRHRVEVGDPSVRLIVEHVADEVGADESGPSGDQVVAAHGNPLSRRSRLHGAAARRHLSARASGRHRCPAIRSLFPDHPTGYIDRVPASSTP